MEKILDKIHLKLGMGAVLTALTERLSPSELNTFLLALFRERALRVDPARLLRQFAANRFVPPAAIDPLALRRLELDWLIRARSHHFEPLTLSPLAPLGACSAVGLVDQNNVVSALRGTEVVSDATNVLALQIARDAKEEPVKAAVQRYATVHRHVRGQAFENPLFSAHFSVFCLASGGWDQGHRAFELNQLEAHLGILLSLLSGQFPAEDLSVRFYLKQNGEAIRDHLTGHSTALWQRYPHTIHTDPGHAYYDLFQFKVFLRRGDQSVNLADGGPVNWTQRLLSNRKHRCFISGAGLELVLKLTEGA